MNSTALCQAFCMACKQSGVIASQSLQPHFHSKHYSWSTSVCLQFATMGTEAEWNPERAREHYMQGREIQVYGQRAAAFDGLTSYRQDYQPHPLEPRLHHGAGQGGHQSLPFDGTTTYAAEYQAHPLPQRHHHEAPRYQGSGAPFDGTTTYKSNYIPHAMERAQPHKMGGGERAHLPFDGTTSYRNDYTAHPLPERAVAAGGPYSPPHVPFDGATTYKQDFVPHEFEGRPQHMHANTGVRQSLPFDGTTTYNDYFKPFPIQPHAATGRGGEFRPSGAKFEGMSETMDKYRAWAMDPANRRNGGGPPPMRPSLPFDGTTTNREMFKGWQLPPRRPALGVQMVGDMAYVLIPPSAPIPAIGRQTFTTVHDGQTEVSILVLEGDFTQASRCNVLGQIDLTGLPSLPKGQLKVEVTFHIDEHGVLNVTAHDLDHGKQEQWLREGYMVARVAP